MGRRSRTFEHEEVKPSEPAICPLCDRPIPSHARSSRHHLIPKLKGGTHKGTVRLHQICHSAIHARYSEAELARRLTDVEELKRDPELSSFLEWVRKKPDDFHARTSMSKPLSTSRTARRR